MLEDDLNPKTKKPSLKNLSPLSLADLNDYISFLRDEITRAEVEIAKKKNQLFAADSFFKKKEE